MLKVINSTQNQYSDTELDLSFESYCAHQQSWENINQQKEFKNDSLILKDLEHTTLGDFDQQSDFERKLGQMESILADSLKPKDVPKKKKIKKLKKIQQQTYKFLNFPKITEKLQIIYKKFVEFSSSEKSDKIRILNDFSQLFQSDDKQFYNFKSRNDLTMENFLLQVFYFIYGGLKNKSNTQLSQKSKLDNDYKKQISQKIKEQLKNQTCKSTNILKILNCLNDFNAKKSFVHYFDELKTTNAFSDILMINKEEWKLHQQLTFLSENFSSGFCIDNNLEKSFFTKKFHDKKEAEFHCVNTHQDFDISSFYFCEKQKKADHRIPVNKYLKASIGKKSFKQLEKNFQCVYQKYYSELIDFILDVNLSEQNFLQFLHVIDYFIKLAQIVLAWKSTQKGIKQQERKH